MQTFVRAVLIAGIVLAAPFVVYAHDSFEEHIDLFSVDMLADADGELAVTETIVYDFGQIERHGIFRLLPYRYARDGATYTIRYDVTSVTDENGDAYPFSVSKTGGNVEVKIGDADFTISGIHTYVLTYSVQRAINFFDDHDEVYWNATGNEWQVPILESDARVTLPPGVAGPDIDVACYTGSYGDVEQKCSSDVAGATATFNADRAFDPYEGLTIVVGFPKGVIKEPTLASSILLFFKDNWILGLPIAVFVFLHMLWMKRGRDPKGRGTVIPEYEPPEHMDPAILGALWDEKADPKDISAEIIHLAVRGYLKIKNTGKKEYEFIKIKNADSSLNSVERGVYDSLFSEGVDTVTLDSLKNKYYKKLAGIQKTMYEELVKRSYYAKNPNAIRNTFYGIGVAVLVLIFFTFEFSGIFWVPLLVTGILIMVYGRIMPQKTVHGAEKKEQVQGFKWFLSVTEEERLKFHNAPEKKPEQFEHFLPYAMVLGVEKEWAKQFAGMYLAEPSWYEGGHVGAFNAVIFASLLSDMNTKMNSTLVSKPSSAGGGGSGFGGGGFSGGGFGGGGGGSW